MVPLKYLSNFWRTLDVRFINHEINLILTSSANCVISNSVANQAATLAITDIKLYILVVTLSTQDIAKLLQQLKSGFKDTITWNKYQSKITTQNAPNQYLIEPSFQRVNILFYRLILMIIRKDTSESSNCKKGRI